MMPDPVDHERPRGDNAFDHDRGYSGQDYDRTREAEEGARAVEPVDNSKTRDLPPDNGRPASADRVTGEVHGSGVGTGGGQEGEDFSSDAATGNGYPLTGGEGQTKTPGDLGPARAS